MVLQPKKLPKSQHPAPAKYTKIKKLAIQNYHKLALMAFAVILSCSANPVTGLAEPTNDQTSATDELFANIQERWNIALETDNIGVLKNTTAYDYEDEAIPKARTALPTKFDLRDRGVVTPVKTQMPWGTCWGFAAIAASETSILSELGCTYDEYPLDLSELQISWFAQTPLPKDSGAQANEGNYPEDPKNRLSTGGYTFNAISLFSSGIGPITEKEAPYKNKEGYAEYDYDGHPINYSTDGDWSVDESLRFKHAFRLEESSILPAPAHITYDQNGTPATYKYNETGTLAIKKELMAGRAVATNLCGDLSLPGYPTEEQYLNTETWSHYTYEPLSSNHIVTIVGWDDNYDKSNFTEGHRPPQNGAWIVKNSWGAEDQPFPNWYPGGWGIDGTGYFYLSYYDQSLDGCETLDFDTDSLDDDNKEYYTNAYDYLPLDTVNTATTNIPTSMSNIFVAKDDQVIHSVATETATPGTTANFKVYLLDSNSTIPTDGTLVSQVSQTYEYGGFHKANLDKGIPIKKDQKFSVVVELQTPSGKYEILTNAAINKDGFDQLRAQGIETDPFYSVGIVNPGESYICENGTWHDWSTELDRFEQQYDAGVDMDNFAIKAYSDRTNKSEDQEDDQSEQKPTKPTIIQGADSTWRTDCSDGLTFISDATIQDFIEVQVDGNVINDNSYSINSGSTIITLKPEFLKSLSAGNHSISIVSKNGTATASFTIVEITTKDPNRSEPVSASSSNEKNPDSEKLADTSDHTTIELYVLIGISIIASSTYILARKRKHY